MNLFSALTGVTSVTKDADGSVTGCMLDQYNEVDTACGRLVPKWQDENVRRKNIPSLSFYPDGALKAVYLDVQLQVKTPLGEYPAEFVTFYPSGTLCRVFPVNGKISGYWSQEDEAELCPQLSFRLPCGSFRAKLISLHFYESGALRSLALWPGEFIVLRTNVGVIPARGGAAFYEDGSLESVEPPHPLPVETPVGVLTAFDSTALNIHGDKNSLSFYPDSTMRSITTSSDRVEVILPDHSTVVYAPVKRPDPLLEDRTIIEPLRLSFDKGLVTLENGEDSGTYSLSDCCFRTFTQEGGSTEALRQSPTTCGDCSTCNLCG